MFRRFPSALTVMILLGLAPLQALAAQTVTARGADREGYTRVVFRAPPSVAYTVSRISDGRLRISFQASDGVAFDTSGLAPSGLENIDDVRTQEAAGQVDLAFAPGRAHRHFRIGERVVVDILNPETKAQNSALAPSPSPSPPPVSPDAQTKPVPPQASSEPASSVPAPPSAPPSAPAPSPPPPEEAGAALGREHVITLGATEAVGVAAFERAEHLWILVNRPGVNVPPQLAGPDQDLFGEFERFDLENATVFRMKIPEIPYIYAEGGGLLWRLILTGEERRDDTTEMQRQIDKSGIRGDSAIWPMSSARDIIRFKDPFVGDILHVVPVGRAGEHSGPRQDYVDFSVMRSAVGIALRGKVDDLQVKSSPNGIQVDRPGGLALSSPSDLAGYVIENRTAITPEEKISKAGETGSNRIFHLNKWILDDESDLLDNERLLLASLDQRDKDIFVQDLLNLSKLFIASGWGPEALGYLDYALQTIPRIEEGAQFRALRGAAEALSGKYDLAFRDLSVPALLEIQEITIWRAYVLARLEDWQQAARVMPANLEILRTYPLHLQNEMALTMAEIALRDGAPERAQGILDMIRRNEADMRPERRAWLSYLTGEAARQTGDAKRAAGYWEPLASGNDDLFRAKAGLALTNLKYSEGDITIRGAIDRLEGLRFAWRGDELETLINFRLGQLYIEEGRFLKGFSTLRRASKFSGGAGLGDRIADYMSRIFRDLFIGEMKDRLSPLDAVSLYERFSDLTPPGSEGNRLVQALAERLVEVDLLGRAGDVLKDLLDKRMDGMEAAHVASRLAAIRLLDGRPEEALVAVRSAERILGAMESEAALRQKREISLLRARALSRLGRSDQALAILAQMIQDENVVRLRADISWQAERWNDAAEALRDLMDIRQISPYSELSDEAAVIVLNHAVALNLAGNRHQLDSIRERFGDSMARTKQARLFDVVSRSRQSGVLADRQTINAIVAEVDLFKEFLENFHSLVP